jgi:hypothetical protein
MDCIRVAYSVLLFVLIPFRWLGLLFFRCLVLLPFRWLHAFANYGHAIESRVGIPSWIGWFSAPDLIINQIFEATMFHIIFGSPGMVVLAEEMGCRPANWWRQVWFTIKISVVAWLGACFVSLLAQQFKR